MNKDIWKAFIEGWHRGVLQSVPYWPFAALAGWLLAKYT